MWPFTSRPAAVLPAKSRSRFIVAGLGILTAILVWLYFRSVPAERRAAALLSASGAVVQWDWGHIWKLRLDQQMADTSAVGAIADLPWLANIDVTSRERALALAEVGTPSNWLRRIDVFVDDPLRNDAEDDRILEWISKCHGLDTISLRQVHPSAEAIGRFRELRNLKGLCIEGGGVDDGAMAQIGKLTQLTRLSVSRSDVGDVGANALTDVTQLKFLFLSRTRVTDAGIPAIARLQRLEELQLSHCRISGLGISRLAALPSLKTLVLDDSRIEDADFAMLEKLPELEVVSVRNTHITNKALDSIRQMPHLKSIDVTGTDVDENAEVIIRSINRNLQYRLSPVQDMRKAKANR